MAIVSILLRNLSLLEDTSPKTGKAHVPGSLSEPNFLEQQLLACVHHSSQPGATSYPTWVTAPHSGSSHLSPFWSSGHRTSAKSCHRTSLGSRRSAQRGPASWACLWGFLCWCTAHCPAQTAHLCPHTGQLRGGRSAPAASSLCHCAAGWESRGGPTEGAEKAASGRSKRIKDTTECQT
jgi:hypothetical protein